MKMAGWFSRHIKLLFILIGLALLGACGSDTNEDLTTPTLTMDALAPSTFTSERKLSGQIEADAGLEFAVSTGAKVGEISINDGAWSCTITDLAVGSNLVTISADDSRGNTRSLQVVLFYDLLKIDQADTVTAQDSSTVYGRLAPGAEISSVTLSGNPMTLPGNGDSFSILLEGLAAGSNTVTIKAEDAASGDTQTTSLTIVSDVTAVLLAIEKPLTPTEEHSLELTGTVEEGGEVVVSVEPEAAMGDVSNPTTTSWSVAISDLEERDNIITVTASQSEEGRITASAWTRVTVNSSPTVVETEPVDGMDTVPPEAVLTATFSEAMVASSVTATTFRIEDALGAPVEGEVAYSADDTAATFTPAAPLDPGSYIATIDGVEDPDGNTIDMFSWSFTVQ